MKKAFETPATCQAYKATVDDLTVLMIPEEGYYECYLKKPGYSYRHMFGLPEDSQTLQEAMQIALVNAPDYLDLFDDYEDDED